MALEVETPAGGQEYANTTTAAAATTATAAATGGASSNSLPSSAARASVGSSMQSSSGGAKLPNDEIEITFLMQSGEKATCEFKTTDSILEAKEKLIAKWPNELGAKPSSALELKLLYSGRYLENDSVLTTVQRYADHPTVVHLMVNYNRSSPKEAKKDVSKAPKCTCVIL
ncbi:hypothetical protein GGI26_000022 [Coemansia sp. RSA 1358]|uniref:Ubiquitin-like domain-containing protein n=1 Tax=Coemansia umbellata TaxID=1424467 RepID=A0ABQ8PXQ4_9FUNG|nr:hypothetical protein EDC05_000195 [Coemansia umbellata]KAJ2625938.1 hypothetical protein GGI26_000022 [Coemansia sp. RSA 1358]